MTYLICQDCGKYYHLDEGKTSFNFQRCECGGKLEYSPTSKDSSTSKNSTTSKDSSTLKKVYEKTYQHQPAPTSSKIRWKGVLVGFLFLFVCLILSVIGLFGTNIPSNPSDISYQILTYFTIITVILTISAGSISAYLSGSSRYVEGAINGGMVGVILGFILGLVGGLMVFLSGILIFGLLSMLGGIIGIFHRKISK